MAFSLEEKPNSRTITTWPPSIEVLMTATGEFDEWTALCNCYFGTPLQYFHPDGATLYRQDIKLTAVGHAIFDVVVPYGPRNIEEGNATFTFDTGGATINVRHGRAHVNDYATDGNNVNKWGGLINATSEDVQGADIVIPALRLTWSFAHPKGDITIAQVKALAAATGTTNSATFRGFAAGELLFVGASGAEGTDSPASIAYNCIASQNVTGLTIGSITGIAKSGHAYLWAEYADAVVGGEAGKTLRRINVERLYESSNFASVFGWS